MGVTTDIGRSMPAGTGKPMTPRADIRREPVRLSLGWLLSGIARFRFAGHQYTYTTRPVRVNPFRLEEAFGLDFITAFR